MATVNGDWLKPDLIETAKKMQRVSADPRLQNKDVSKWMFLLASGFLVFREVFDRQREEIAILRQYGNKDCTAMADEELERRRGKSHE